MLLLLTVMAVLPINLLLETNVESCLGDGQGWSNKTLNKTKTHIIHTYIQTINACMYHISRNIDSDFSLAIWQSPKDRQN